MVLGAGLEPAWSHDRRHLKPVRLPTPPPERETWSAHQDSSLGPLGCGPSALPLSYARMKMVVTAGVEPAWSDL